MNGWTFGAHAFWAASFAVTCAISPIVPIAIVAMLLFKRREDDELE